MYIPPLTWAFLAVGMVCIYIVCRFTDRPRTPEQTFELSRRKTHGPYGVASWLLILVAILLLCGPVLMFFRTHHEFLVAEERHVGITNDPRWSTLKLASWATFAMWTALAIYAALELMFRRRWVAVKRAIVILWITGPLAFVVDEVVLPFLVYAKVATSGSEFLGYLLSPILAAGAWTAYLLNSKRVRATYQRPTKVAGVTTDA